jgi:dihydroorotase
MPNTNPLTTTAEALADKVSRGLHRMHCDFAFWVGGTHENAKDVPELERLPGAAGIKVFMGSSTGSLLVEDDPGVAAILSQTRRRAAFHAEDEYRLNERKPIRVTGDPNSHPVWRDVETALGCTQRLVKIAQVIALDQHLVLGKCGVDDTALEVFCLLFLLGLLPLGLGSRLVREPTALARLSCCGG